MLGETIELLYKGLPRKFVIHFMDIQPKQDSISVIHMVNKNTQVRIHAEEKEKVLQSLLLLLFTNIFSLMITIIL
jgi:hypothetical protein